MAKKTTYYWGTDRPAKPGFQLKPFRGVTWVRGMPWLEDEFERIRAAEFKDRPPRVGSFYVCPDLHSEFCGYAKYVYEVEVEGSHKAFETDGGVFTSAVSWAMGSGWGPGHPKLEAWIRRYWKGYKNMKGGASEVLIHGGRVKVVREITKEERRNRLREDIVGQVDVVLSEATQTIKIAMSAMSVLETDVIEVAKDPSGHGLDRDERRQYKLLASLLKSDRLTIPDDPQKREDIKAVLLQLSNSYDAQAHEGLGIEEKRFAQNASRALSTLNSKIPWG